MEWKIFLEYPQYEISNNCIVRNKETLKTLPINKIGNVTFPFITKNKQRIFSVKKLVRIHFSVDITDEIWTSIPDQNTHEISNLGRVRHIRNRNILKTSMRGAYKTVRLPHNNKYTQFSVHALVAKSFLKNSDLKKQTCINHINGNKLDNRPENLEYCTFAENNRHAIANKLTTHYSRPIIKLDLDTKKEIKTYRSAVDAGIELGVSNKFISFACSHNTSAYGFRWKFVNDTRTKNDDNVKGEDWKEFFGYRVSNFGNIKNSKTKVNLLPRPHPDGGLRVSLHINKKQTDFYIHRLVAMLFILNPDNKPEVDHINSNRKDNCATNLRWVTGKENSRFAHAKMVKQFDFEGNLIKTFDSIVDAAKETQCSKSGISSCCNKKNKTCRGFQWEFAYETTEPRYKKQKIDK